MSFICDDSTFVFVAGCILLLAPGFNRVLGGSLAEVEKVRSISKIVKEESISTKWFWMKNWYKTFGKTTD